MLNITWKDKGEKYDLFSYVDKLNITPPLKKQLDSNLLIKGDNYPVLYKLNGLYKNYIDIIYIDPPYNTGNEFTYNDSFGSKDEKHDAWLSFMERRLKLSKTLLKESGCIFIAIDQSELYVLKLLCDKVFGEDNFVNDFMWLHGKGKKDSWSRTLQQHTLCYARNKKKLKSFSDFEESNWAKTNADNDPRGNWFSGSISFSEERSNKNHKNYYSITSPSGIVWTRQWQVSEEEMKDLLEQKKIFFGYEPSYDKVPRIKIFNNEKKEIIPKNIIDITDSTREAQNHLDALLGVKGAFDNPKPVSLISHLIEITNMGKNSVILDFFGGSGTTYEAVCELNKKDEGNRKVIIVQKDEKVTDKKVYGYKKNSASISTVFSSIFDICKTRIEKVNDLYKENLTICELVE